MDVIITDHYILGSFLPDAFAILNPKQNNCRYPFKELYGADLVSVKDENRVIVHCGLQILWTTHRPGLRELLKIVNMDLYRDLTVNRWYFILLQELMLPGD